MLNFRSFLCEEQATYKYACVMAMLDQESSQAVKDFQERYLDISQIWTRDDEGGLETKPHITVKYGLDNPDPLKMMQEVVRAFQVPLIDDTIRVVAIDKFTTNPDFDVLKLSVSPPKVLLNLRLALEQNFIDKDKFPVYKPHVTLGYFKKGYSKYPTDVRSLLPKHFVYDRICVSMADGTKEYYQIPSVVVAF